MAGKKLTELSEEELDTAEELLCLVLRAADKLLAVEVDCLGLDILPDRILSADLNALCILHCAIAARIHGSVPALIAIGEICAPGARIVLLGALVPHANPDSAIAEIDEDVLQDPVVGPVADDAKRIGHPFAHRREGIAFHHGAHAGIIRLDARKIAVGEDVVLDDDIVGGLGCDDTASESTELTFMDKHAFALDVFQVDSRVGILLAVSQELNPRNLQAAESAILDGNIPVRLSFPHRCHPVGQKDPPVDDSQIVVARIDVTELVSRIHFAIIVIVVDVVAVLAVTLVQVVGGEIDVTAVYLGDFVDARLKPMRDEDIGIFVINAKGERAGTFQHPCLDSSSNC